MPLTQDGDQPKTLATPDQKPEQNDEFESIPMMEIDPEDLRPRPWVLPDRRRIAMVLGVLLVLVGVVVLPPLVSVSRFRQRIMRSVSESLGRPVHIDAVTLTMLPMPGFTLDNFVVLDDPAFSAEPAMQARRVRVTLRVWSLWGRRVEFSRITLTDPSVNLVHRADGKWNIESILLQAAKMEAAPTAQTSASDAPRFPYIEATGARINVKMGLEKMPIALTEADLALWLPQPSEWKLRLEGHPTRTDTAPTDTGVLRVQGTLGKAATIEGVPIDLNAEWRDAPLGGVSWVMLARDAGFRGQMTLRANLQGTVGQNVLETRLELTDLRRADFVPSHTLELDVVCKGQTSQMFHRLSGIRCGWPAEALENAAAPGIRLTGEMPSIAQPGTLTGNVVMQGVSAKGFVDLVRLGSTRVAGGLAADGTIAGKLVCCTGTGGWKWATGTLAVAGARLAVGDGRPFVSGDMAGTVAGGGLTVAPFALELGAPQPAELAGTVDANGYTMHLIGPAMRSRLMELGSALPQFGDGLEAVMPAAVEQGVETPVRVDASSSRAWFGGQSWTAVSAKPVKKKRR